MLSDSSSKIDRGAEVCVEATSLWIVAGYPFPEQHAVEVNAPSGEGFTRRALFEAIVAVHAAMYVGTNVD